MLDRRRMLAAALAAMACPVGGVLAQPGRCHHHVARSAHRLRCVGVISAQATSGKATAASNDNLFMAFPERLISAIADRGSVRSGTGTTRRWSWLPCDPATRVPS